VTFGVKPTHPETGYGYLELGEVPDQEGHAVALERFVEKPDLDTANAMLSDGKYLWNAGIFLFRACDMLEAFSLYAGTVIEAVQSSYDQAKTDLGFLRLDAEAWASVENISIDYGAPRFLTDFGATQRVS
jgi:mannose-1-phosphate guanylyltransferase/mannose-6-phosphate isomerase